MTLKQTLDGFYREYDFKNRALHDPIEFPHRYKNPEDAEAAGFISSCFAYGRVELFKALVEKTLSIMGRSPHSFLMDFDIRKHARLITFKYRFNDSSDIACLLYLLNRLLVKHSSLRDAFMEHYTPDDLNTGNSIAGFISEIMSIDTSGVYGRNIRPRGLIQFFPSPQKGSACKRMNLFLRWMIRNRDIDLGIWKGIPKNKLVIPLDTHIAKISRCLGLTKRASTGWKAAVGITEALKLFDPEDPLKYDFALCHHGISGMCKGDNIKIHRSGRTQQHSNSACEKCVFNGFAAH